MMLKTVGKSGGLTPEQMKRKVPKFQNKTIIKYGQEVFKIKWSELINLGLDNYKEIESRSESMGQDDIRDLRKACFDCNYNAQNILHTFVNQVNLGKDCRYENPEGARIANQCVNIKEKISLYAEEPSCVIFDAAISYLAENKQLEKYKVQEKFNYPSIEKLESGEVNYRDFPYKKLTLLDKLKNKVKL